MKSNYDESLAVTRLFKKIVSWHDDKQSWQVYLCNWNCGHMDGVSIMRIQDKNFNKIKRPRHESILSSSYP